MALIALSLPSLAVAVSRSVVFFFFFFEIESFVSYRQSWETPLEGAVQYKVKIFEEKMPGSI